MNTETNTETNLTEQPAKKRALRNPFTKKNDTAHKGAPYGIYTAGVILVVAGGVSAIVSKLGRKDETETAEVPADTTAA